MRSRSAHWDLALAVEAREWDLELAVEARRQRQRRDSLLIQQHSPDRWENKHLLRRYLGA